MVAEGLLLQLAAVNVPFWGSGVAIAGGRSKAGRRSEVIQEGSFVNGFSGIGCRWGDPAEWPQFGQS
ncbi:Fc.00g016280.m01.CDS01 [Cosmosporella sp. VM-42]